MLNHFLSLIRVCSICGAKAGQNIIYCSRCRTAVEQAAIHKGWGTDGPIDHHYLFEINTQKKDHHYRQLIRLKEGPAPILTSWLCRLLIKKRTLLVPEIASEVLIVPAPSSTERDHAHRLADECARQLKTQSLDILEKQNSESQKERSLYERFYSEVGIKKKSEVIRGKNLIVVDDLITTGHTAFDCARALEKQAKSVEVWAPYRTVLLHPHVPFDITHPDEEELYCNTFNISDGKW